MMRGADEFLNRWSPWRLRTRLRDVQFWLGEDLWITSDDDCVNTANHQLSVCIGRVLDGASWEAAVDDAKRETVRGRTLHIDAT
jgi:hypothetical protein